MESTNHKHDHASATAEDALVAVLATIRRYNLDKCGIAHVLRTAAAFHQIEFGIPVDAGMKAPPIAPPGDLLVELFKLPPLGKPVDPRISEKARADFERAQKESNRIGAAAKGLPPSLALVTILEQAMAYHVSQDLGDEWADHQDLAHIEGGEKVRALAIPIGVLIKDPDNVRKHPQENMDGVRGSLAKYNQRQVICVNKRNMIVEAGNARLQAGASMGWRFVAVLFVDDDPLTQAGYAIADNRTAEMAEWDLPALFGQLKSLKEADVEVPGISEEFFEELKVLTDNQDFQPPEGQGGEDPGASDPPKEPVSKEGEIYALGPHRLCCGSSTDRESVKRLFGEDLADLVNTDPPYGVAYEGGTKDKLTIQNDALTLEETQELWQSSLSIACSFSKEGASCYVFTPTMPDQLSATLGGWRDSGWACKHTLIWNKSAFALGRSDYHYKHEGIFYGWKPGAGHYFIDDRTQSTVLDFDKPKANDVHPTMKPVEIVQKLIENSTKTGAKVYDPFTGSGSCLIASARCGRVFLGMELDPRYCDVVRKRWGDYARQLGIDAGPDAL